MINAPETSLPRRSGSGNANVQDNLAHLEKSGKVTKLGAAIKLVAARAKKKFTSKNHMQASRYYKARPISDGAQPGNTSKEFCIYHSAHRDYTYGEKWVEKLVAAVSDDTEFAKIKAMKV